MLLDQPQPSNNNYSYSTAVTRRSYHRCHYHDYPATTTAIATDHYCYHLLLTTAPLLLHCDYHDGSDDDDYDDGSYTYSHYFWCNHCVFRAVSHLRRGAICGILRRHRHDSYRHYHPVPHARVPVEFRRCSCNLGDNRSVEELSFRSGCRAPHSPPRCRRGRPRRTIDHAPRTFRKGVLAIKRIAYLLMWVLLIGLAPSAWAQEKQKISFKMPAENSKYTQQQMIDVGDVPGHLIRIADLRRTFPANPPVFDGVKAVEAWTRLSPTSSTGRGASPST